LESFTISFLLTKHRCLHYVLATETPLSMHFIVAVQTHPYRIHKFILNWLYSAPYTPVMLAI